MYFYTFQDGVYKFILEKKPTSDQNKFIANIIEKAMANQMSDGGLKIQWTRHESGVDSWITRFQPGPEVTNADIAKEGLKAIEKYGSLSFEVVDANLVNPTPPMYIQRSNIEDWKT